jgi:hypothetical protein
MPAAQHTICSIITKHFQIAQAVVAEHHGTESFTKLISHPATLAQDLIDDFSGLFQSTGGLTFGPDKNPFVSRKLFGRRLAAFNIKRCLRAHIDAGTAERALFIGLSHFIYYVNSSKGA